MIRRLLFGACLALFPAAAFADDTAAAAAVAVSPAQNTGLYYAHLGVLFIGLFYSGIVAAQAFGREVKFDDVPTFPKYMTRKSQYMSGLSCFVLVSMLTFFLLVYLNKEVTPIIDVFNHDVYEKVKKNIDGESPSYFVIVVLISVLFVTLFHWENDFNPVLMFRNLIQLWIRIPFLAKRIAHLVKNGLVVPADAIAAVAGSALTPTVHLGDFAKNPKTIERRWAEVSYIKWWLDQHHREEDASFFAEKSFNWDGLVKDYDECGIAVTAARDEAIQNQKTKEILSKFADECLERLHIKFARLIACYLVYKHGSYNDLRIAAEHFGIDFFRPSAENPLSYSIIYVGTAVAAVYIGVYFSAIIYDLIQGEPLSQALSSQDHDLVMRWVAFTAANYGTPIVAILGIRYLLNKFNMDTARSYIARYFWVFFVAVVVGPFFLAVAVKAFGTPAARAIDFLTMYHRSLVWGIGPGLVCVYLYYYLDRQTQPDLPDIVQQRGSILLRLFVSFIFTCVVMLILLPPLMEIKVTYQSAWDNNKVRFVATSVAFLLTLSLAVVAQFGLRKPPTPTAPAAKPASPGRGVPIETGSMRLPRRASTLSAVEQ